MTHLILGEPAPVFTAPSPSRREFHFSSLGGRFLLLGFLPSDPQVREVALSTVRRHREMLSDDHVAGFLVESDPVRFSEARDERGLRWFFDPEGTLARLYGVRSAEGEERPFWFLIDPSLRLLSMAPLANAEAMFARLRTLPAIDAHAGTQLHAPVLVVPRVLEPALCQQLIDVYDRDGGSPSGVMREAGGKTVGVLDDFKRRRDAKIDDEPLRHQLRAVIARRLVPEIEKAFQFKITRIERYIVAHYDAADGGYFRAHRDNTTAGTVHRRFAVSINLNAEQFEGGDLRFPEFGTRTYRPPTGGAVVFSCSLLHEATPVTRGRRYAFLPFLFDEAGEEIRQQNLHLLRRLPETTAPAEQDGAGQSPAAGVAQAS